MKVLVLDSTWEASAVISLKRACLLLLAGKAIPVTDEVIGTLRSPSTEVNVPSVIQILTAPATRKLAQMAPECSRQRVLTRDNKECQFIDKHGPCLERATTIDHLTPSSRGGKNTWENLVGACWSHNSRKKDRTLEEVGWGLKQKPVAPMFMLRTLSNLDQIHPTWTPFLST